jgi:chaperonin GroES
MKKNEANVAKAKTKKTAKKKSVASKTTGKKTVKKAAKVGKTPSKAKARVATKAKTKAKAIKTKKVKTKASKATKVKTNVKSKAPIKSKAQAKLKSKGKVATKTKAPAKSLVKSKLITKIELDLAIEKIFVPLDDRVLVEAISGERVTAGGLIIPDTVAIQGNKKGNVVAVGRGHRDNKGRILPMDVTPGDVVLYSEHSGSKIQIGNKSLLVLRESEILGVVNS